MKKIISLSLLSFTLVFTSCFEDFDDNVQEASTSEIQNFIYRGLNFFYLYKADTPELANNAFENDGELNDFLDNYETPEALFNFLKSDQDNFSILVDDYIALENAINGVSVSNGMEFGLVFYPDMSGNLFGYVRYVLPNTDAASEGLQRGDIFNSVDGQQLTETNFNDLLSSDSYTIGLATFDGQTITPIQEEIELTKTQYIENPVFLARTLDVDGQNVGYIMYNAFTRNFDEELNNAFGQFQADGVTELVLDLRYNGGGSVETATDLASMITGQFNNQIFYTEEWNADRQEEYAEPGFFDGTISNGNDTNSLNLTRVYVLTTRRSASASELVINSLAPYIDVIQIGQNTAGKFQASFILYDAPAPNFSRSQANPGHTYAMLPLVFKTVNAAGNTDFIDGLVPDIEQNEDFSNLGMLGDPNEPFLATALSQISGAPRPTLRNTLELEEKYGSDEQSPVFQLMYVEDNK